MTRARAAALVALISWWPCIASAQDWPNRPVTIVVPFPAGGTADLLARELAQALSDDYRQQFVVENRTGAGGNLAGAAVAKADADGSTLLFASQSQAALNQLMFKNLSYDPMRDLVPASLVVKMPLALIAARSAPVATFEEILEHGRANPGKLTIGNPGVGSMGHIAAELLQQRLDVKITHVPYRGGAPLVTDLMGGHLQFGVDLIANFLRLAKAGEVRALAVTSVGRQSVLPDVPTIQERLGSPFEATAWFAMMVPTGTSIDARRKVSVTTDRFLRSSKGQELIATQALEAAGGSPDEATAFINAEVAKWRPVIKAANILFE